VKEMPIDAELLDILVCPACRTKVELAKDAWLVCSNPQCRRKYPVVQDIPIMLIEEGDKYADVAVDDLDISKVTLEEVGA
jgi:uncharacterized protein YbaR (Trm112 family)